MSNTRIEKKRNLVHMKHILLMLLTLLFFACTPSPELLQEAAKDFCSEIHSPATERLEEVLAPIQDKLENQTAALALEDGGNSMMARAWLCEHAEKTIDIQYFIFATDNVGLIACDYLVRAADRGVKVRLLIDDILVDAGPHEILSLSAHPNIEIKIYNPGINLGKNIVQKLSRFATDFQGANQRMHNKTFTVDNRAVITGGRNIADEYFDYDHAYNFRDRDVLLLGKSVSAVSASFESFWQSPLSVPVEKLVKDEHIDGSDSTRYERVHQYACNPENFWPQVRTKIRALLQIFQNLITSGELLWMDSVRYVSDVPGKNTAAGNYEGGATTTALAELIRHAKKEIIIQTPYLNTTTESRALLSAAVKRGVRIRILTNSLSSTYNFEAFSGYSRDPKTLIETGVRIFEFRPDAKERYDVMTGELQKKMNYTPIFGWHTKSMVIDGEITVIGTFNMDPRSANYNTECITILHSRPFCRGVQTGMERELQPENSWETTRNFNPDGTANLSKRLQTMSRRIVPKGIL